MAVKYRAWLQRSRRGCETRTGESSYVLFGVRLGSEVELTKRIKKPMPENSIAFIMHPAVEANGADVKFARHYCVVAGRPSEYKYLA
jgi:hypothetical protein